MVRTSAMACGSTWGSRLGGVSLVLVGLTAGCAPEAGSSCDLAAHDAGDLQCAATAVPSASVSAGAPRTPPKAKPDAPPAPVTRATRRANYQVGHEDGSTMYLPNTLEGGGHGRAVQVRAVVEDAGTPAPR